MFLRGFSLGNVTRMVDTTAESIIGALKLGNLNLGMLCASGSWRFLHLVTDDYSGNKKMRKLLEAELTQNQRPVGRFLRVMLGLKFDFSLNSLIILWFWACFHRATIVTTRFSLIMRATCMCWHLSTF